MITESDLKDLFFYCKKFANFNSIPVVLKNVNIEAEDKIFYQVDDAQKYFKSSVVYITKCIKDTIIFRDQYYVAYIKLQNRIH